MNEMHFSTNYDGHLECARCNEELLNGSTTPQSWDFTFEDVKRFAKHHPFICRNPDGATPTGP